MDENNMRELASTHGVTVGSMRVNTWMIRSMAMADIFGLMGEYMKGIGLKVNSMVLVNTGCLSKT